VAREHLVAVLTAKGDDFERFHKILTAGPVVSEGFFARPEGVSVYSARRRDEAYGALEKFSSPLWQRGFNRQDILQRPARLNPLTNSPDPEAVNAQMLALLLKSMEEESELRSTTHDASRQLLYAAGLLPRHVAAPEWALFGMGSFFETPPEAPWPGVGAPSIYYLPRFQELKGGRLERTAYETLYRVVTDGYFRYPNPLEPPEAALQKARATSWSLTYFLAETKLKGLQRYFQELGKMPRDLELDEEVLLGCFARAFDAVDANNQVDPKKLNDLANQWYGYMAHVPLEAKDLLDQIRGYYAEMKTRPQPGTVPTNPRAGQPPRIPPGFRPPRPPAVGPRPPRGGPRR
jgi:hypothetical protein